MDDFRRPEASEHYQRALALERAGRIDEALAEYRRAVDTDPGFSEAYEALGYHYQQRGLLTRALDAFRTLARLEGGYNAHFNVGYILVELERYEEALEAFQQCLALSPADPSALYEIAYIHYLQGRLPEALAAVHLSLQADSGDWRLHNLLGACHLGMERWAEAEAHYGRAVSLASTPEEIGEARAGLLAAQRYQEFTPGQALGLKERLYADAGAVLLGSAGDDGLHIVVRTDLSLAPLPIAVTLVRLRALLRAWPLDLAAVVAVDRDSLPLAGALEKLLSLPRKQLSQLGAHDRALLLLLAGRQPELLQVALEQAAPGSLSFVFALYWYGQHDFLPDLIGVPVKEEPARFLNSPATAGHEALTVAALLEACAALPPEPNLEEQVRYYTGAHRRLRFGVGQAADAQV